MSLETHYKLLGLAPGSSLAVVKRAYLREIKIWHPDRYSPESLLRSEAEERTKALTTAYTALTAALKSSAHEPVRRESRSTQSAEARPREKSQRAAQSQAAPSIGKWMGRVWQRLKAQWNGESASPKPTFSSAATAKKSAAKRSARKTRQPRFDDVLAAVRNHPKSPSDISVVWRRLAARRSRYGRRRGAGGASIEPIKPRGPVRPVDPVDRIQPIGKDG